MSYREVEEKDYNLTPDFYDLMDKVLPKKFKRVSKKKAKTKKKSVSPTRAASFRLIKSRGESIEQVIMNYLKLHGARTRQELVIEMGLSINTVSGRIPNLFKKGLVVGIGARLNPKTGMMNQIVEAVRVEAKND